MSEVSVTLNGRIYDINCDPGQEGRIVDLAAYVDQKLQQIARSGGAYNDTHLMVLTALVLADEIFETHEQIGQVKRAAATTSRQQQVVQPAASGSLSKDDEQALVRLLDQMTRRIEDIADRVQAA